MTAPVLELRSIRLGYQAGQPPVLADVDPHGLFRNPYVERHLFDGRGPHCDARVFKRIRRPAQE